MDTIEDMRLVVGTRHDQHIAQLTTAREALSQAGVTASQVRAIGITNQRETVVVWNRRTGEPISNAIVWQDRRTEACVLTQQIQHRMSAATKR